MRNKSALTVALMLGVLVAACAFLIQRARRSADSDSPPLLFFCAAGMKAPITEIVEAYKSETGRQVDVQFGGSGTLLANLAVGPGDLYLAADRGYLDDADERGWIEERFEIAEIKPGFVVAKGNPQEISKTADLVEKKDLKIALANPDAAAVGKATRKILQTAGIWNEVEKRTTVFKPTVNELITDVKLGTVDVAVAWDAVTGLVDGVDFVATPEFDRGTQTVSFAVLKRSKASKAAFHFARYLAASDRGVAIFKKHGFNVLEGDPWDANPELVLYSGSMLRPAIENRIRLFQDREGVVVRPVYNGCGILVAQMKAGETPDAYFACDSAFLDMVQDSFEPGTDISRNQIVVIVSKSAADRIAKVADIANPGLRIGIAHPEKSALGSLTTKMLEQIGLQEKLEKSGNVVVESPTGDFLVNQIRAGGLDAALVYRSNAQAHPETRESVTVLEIDHPSAHATQPWAISKETRFPRLAARLQSWLTEGDARASYEDLGFSWER